MPEPGVPTDGQDDVSALVPDDYKRLGFSGLFHLDVALDPAWLPALMDEWEARLPCRVPLGTNSGWLAVRLNRDATPPTMTLVRDDAAAIIEAYTTPREASL